MTRFTWRMWKSLSLAVLTAVSLPHLAAAEPVAGRTVSGESGFFTVVDGRTASRGEIRVSTSFSNQDYLTTPLPELRPPSRREYRDMDLDDTRVFIGLGYGISDRWEVAAVANPYARIYQNAGDLAGYVAGVPYVGRVNENGSGDLRLTTKFQIVQGAGSSLALSGGVELPVGDESKGFSTGSLNAEGGVHWSSRRLAASLRYRAIGDRDASNGIAAAFDLPDELHAGVAFVTARRNWSRTSWISELTTTAYVGGDRSPDVPVYVMTGLRHQFGAHLTVDAGIRVNATMAASSNKSHPIGGVLTFGWKM